MATNSVTAISSDSFIIQSHVLILSQTTNFRLFQIQRVSDDNFKCDENGRRFSKWLKNTVGKGEIACNEVLYGRHVKTRAILGKG